MLVPPVLDYAHHFVATVGYISRTSRYWPHTLQVISTFINCDIKIKCYSHALTSNSFLVPSASEYARHAVATLVYRGRTTGNGPHTLQVISSFINCDIKIKCYSHALTSNSFLVPSASEYARHAVATLVYRGRTTGNGPHTLQVISTFINCDIKIKCYSHVLTSNSFLVPSASEYARHAVATLVYRGRTTGNGPYTLQVISTFINCDIKIKCYSHVLTSNSFLVPSVSEYARHAVATLVYRGRTTGNGPHTLQVISTFINCDIKIKCYSHALTSNSFLVPSASEYARHAVATLVYRGRTTGNGPHTLQVISSFINCDIKIKCYSHALTSNSFLVPSASEYARHAVATLVYRGRTTGNGPHTLQVISSFINCDIKIKCYSHALTSNSFLVPSASEYARHAVATLVYRGRTTGNGPHTLQVISTFINCDIKVKCYSHTLKFINHF